MNIILYGDIFYRMMHVEPIIPILLENHNLAVVFGIETYAGDIREKRSYIYMNYLKEKYGLDKNFFGVIRLGNIQTELRAIRKAIRYLGKVDRVLMTDCICDYSFIPKCELGIHVPIYSYTHGLGWGKRAKRPRGNLYKDIKKYTFFKDKKPYNIDKLFVYSEKSLSHIKQLYISSIRTMKDEYFINVGLPEMDMYYPKDTDTKEYILYITTDTKPQYDFFRDLNVLSIFGKEINKDIIVRIKTFEQIFKNKDNLICDQYSDMCELIRGAHCIISEYSTAIFGALFNRKNCCVIDDSNRDSALQRLNYLDKTNKIDFSLKSFLKFYEGSLRGEYIAKDNYLCELFDTHLPNSTEKLYKHLLEK